MIHLRPTPIAKKGGEKEEDEFEKKGQIRGERLSVSTGKRGPCHDGLCRKNCWPRLKTT